MKCDQCGVCCKLFLINLTEEEYNSRGYKTQFEEFDIPEDFKEAEAIGANIIKQKEDGSCIYQKDNRCRIHKTKPEACMDFFCKSDKKEFKEMIKEINKTL